eukprot:scaffold11462_cov49-Attheya_sp.AAC.3
MSRLHRVIMWWSEEGWRSVLDVDMAVESVGNAWDQIKTGALDIATTTRNYQYYVPLAVMVVVFWPVVVTLVVSLASASTWLFWLMTSLVFGVVQFVYVLYQFVMISLDILGLSALKTFAMLRSQIRYYTIQKSGLSSYSSQRNSNSSKNSKNNSKHRRGRRREWRNRLDMASTYSDYSQIEIEEASPPNEEKESPKQRPRRFSSLLASPLHRIQAVLPRLRGKTNHSSSMSSSSSTSCPLRPSSLRKRSTVGAVASNSQTKSIIRSATLETSSSSLSSSQMSQKSILHRSKSCSANLEDNIESSPPEQQPQQQPQPRRSSSLTRPRSSDCLLVRRRLSGSSLDGGIDSTGNTSTGTGSRSGSGSGSGNLTNGDEDDDYYHWALRAVEKELKMTGEMLVTTTVRLVEARLQAMAAAQEEGTTNDNNGHNDDNDDHVAVPSAASSLKFLLAGVVKRNHLSVDDLLCENSRVVAECGQHRLSPEARDVIRGYQEEVERCLDWVAESSTATTTTSSHTTTTTQTDDSTTIPKTNSDANSTSHGSSTNNNGDPARLPGKSRLFLSTVVGLQSQSSFSSNASQQQHHQHQHQEEIAELQDRITLVRKLKHNMGRTALMLSGGGAQAMYHVGTIRALIEAKVYQGIKVCVKTVSTDYLFTGRMKRENIRWFPKLVDMGAYWLKHKLLVDTADFKRCCEFYYGDITFEEAFQRTGKHVCITVSASRTSSGGGGGAQRLLLNHISTPHVTLSSAVAASCALPGVMTNFHVVPFLNKAHHPNPKSLYWRLFQTCEWDIRNRALNLSRLGLFPRMFGQDFAKVFKQKYHGNITLVPRFTTMQTFGLKALVNPTVEDMEIYLKFGQSAAWPYINVIQEMLRLERAIDRCLSRLDERLRSIKPEFDLRGASSLADDDTDILGMDDSSCHSRRNVHFASSVREAELLKAKLRTLETENKTLQNQVRQLQQTIGIISHSSKNGTPSASISKNIIPVALSVSISEDDKEDDANFHNQKNTAQNKSSKLPRKKIDAKKVR